MYEKPLISFDYAIKYLLKDKGDPEIVEGFLSAVLATEGYKPVKIDALLESASNREADDLKYSIADLIVQDENKNQYLVEVERSLTPHFMHKACFNTSRLVVDSISGGQDYSTLKKVFHISLLYFWTQDMQKPITHGKTVVHEIDTAHPIHLRIANQGCRTFEHHNIFPEYFFISIPLFGDIIHQEVDEWLYMMKYNEVRSDFKSPYMTKVQQKLSVLKMTAQERAAYHKYLKEAAHAQDVLTAAEQKGLEEGLEKGRAEGKAEGIKEGEKMGLEKGLQKGKAEGEKAAKIEVARRMLARGRPVGEIIEDTGLSGEEINQLKKGLD